MNILLTTLHAKYVHSSLALPYLAATCSDLQGARFRTLELTVNEQQDQILAKIVAAQADVVLFSCYIWNTELTLNIASDLKQLAPDCFIVLGGPEVSFGSFEMMQRHPEISCIIRGEGEESCRELLHALCSRLSIEHIAGITYRDGDDVVATPERDVIDNLDTIPSPFEARLVELGKPLVYYETSRGCPFSCAFCMSSLDRSVRSFSMERIKRDLTFLMEAGVQTVKLVDRTFNFDAKRANEIWSFILENNRTSRFHFEIAAELLTPDNLALLATVPPDTFRFEIGVQSAGEQTLAMVDRKSSLDKLFQNVRRLRQETEVTIHLDLVAGLPGESLEGFLASLQGLFQLEPDHIQVEPLKVMKGTQMRSIARKEQYAYSGTAPYQVLRTPWLAFQEIRRIEGISRLLESLYNSKRFAAALAVLGQVAPLSEMFAKAAEHFERKGIHANLSLSGLFDTLWDFAMGEFQEKELECLRDALSYDYCRTGYPGGNLPAFFQRSNERVEKGVPVGLAAGNNGERVRYYRRRFARDYRESPWGEGPVELLFVYRSAPGNGLKVEVALAT